jgi:hypothetical protein
MKSVGEVMGLGRTFDEALMKALASLEGGPKDAHDWTDEQIREALAIATGDRSSPLSSKHSVAAGIRPSSTRSRGSTCGSCTSSRTSSRWKASSTGGS